MPPNSFKGSLTNLEASYAMERGVRAAIPDAEIEIIPMADGGEGTLRALVDSTNGSNYPFPNFFVFNLKLLLTTETELKAIAAPAIIGFNMNPQMGYKIPAAIGIPIKL